MPSLKVPWVWRRKSFSSRRSKSLYSAMDGMVASPTPMMPISSDSTNVMVRRGPMTLAIAAAAIHPAVPPPAMTTDLISCADMGPLLTRIHWPARVPASVRGVRSQSWLKAAISELVAHVEGVHSSVFFVLDDIKRRGAHLIEHERLVGQVAPGQVQAEPVQRTVDERVPNLCIDDIFRLHIVDSQRTVVRGNF